MRCSRRGAEPKRRANWVVSELFGALNRRGESIEHSPVSPGQAAELLRLVADGTISGTIAKQVFEIMLETGEDAGAIVEERGLKQTSDTGAIDNEIDKVLAANADKVAEYRSRQGEAVRLLRRPDDAGDAGQGQPAGRQRAAAGEAGLIRILAVVLAALVAAPAAAQQPPPPKLLVTIRIPGLTSDLFEEYRQKFTGGFAELASGAVFVNGSATPSEPADR